jgi:phage shock protein A
MLASVRDALAAIAESRDQLAARIVELRERLESLEAEAREALAGGSRDRARGLLARRQVVASELELLEEQLRATNDQVERLALVEQQIAARIDLLVTRERLLEAREGAAAIQVRVGEALAGLSEEAGDLSPPPAWGEQRAEELEARAAALDELIDPGAPGAFEVERLLDALELGLEETT